MIQAVAIYAPVSSNEFTLFAHKMDQEFPFASGFTVGGPTVEISALQPDSLVLLSLIDRPSRLLADRTASRTPLEKHTRWMRELNWLEFEPKLLAKGLSKEAFACLAHYADGLLGKDHEGERLSFRIAVATDEGLRECFTPLFGELGLAEQKNEEKFFRIEIPQTSGEVEDGTETNVRWERVINTIDSLTALVQGNYSFLQDSNIFLCLAYVKHGLELRYLAQLNPRLRKASETVLFQSISRIDNVRTLSKTVSPAIIAVLDKDHTGYIAFDGEIRAIGSKGKPNQWRKYSEDDWFHNKLMSTKYPSVKSWGHWKKLEKNFCQDLCKVIELISEAPGKGATFVLGRWKQRGKGLNKICVAMTPVFEMIKGWDLRFVDKDTLYQAAIQDGATVIALDQNRLYCRRQLTSFDIFQGPFDPEKWSPSGSGATLLELWDKPPLENNPYYWPNWGKWFKWGTRHKTAAGLAYIGRGEYSVVCVSSDGDIHLFDGFGVYDLSRVKTPAPES